MTLLSAILLAATVFVATNIDDVFILVGFLADPAYRTRDVILGQFLGVTAMTLLCLALSRATMVVSPAAFGWLGLLDIGIGAKKLYDGRAVARERMIGEPRRYGDGVRTVTLATIGGFGDNVGVYVPLFSGSSVDNGIFCAVVGVMTGLWCLGAYWLVGRGMLGRGLRDIAARITPWMLIVIGIVIISHAGSFGWLFIGVGRG
jgi:cadmium resistance protein CadD (predicted permease)